MSPRKLIFGTIAAVLSLALMGCQPPRKSSLHLGRQSRGTGATTATGQNAPRQPSSGATTWGEITQGSVDFTQALNLFTMPMLNGLDASAQLGYVSPQSGQTTGVMFWGQASMYGGTYTGTGTLDPNSARIHIEIWDDKAASGLQQQTVVHIGSDQDGFVSASGSVNNGQANLTFTDSDGSVILSGTVGNPYFSGTISFTNSYTGGQAQILGSFRVQTCGFFVCQ